ncbi:MAG TPA: hypothetical protein VF136_11675, partial [Methylomirabilota bacterium]
MRRSVRLGRRRNLAHRCWGRGVNHRSLAVSPATAAPSPPPAPTAGRLAARLRRGYRGHLGLARLA